MTVNKLNMSHILNAFNIKQIVPFPARGQSKLDLELTSLSTYYYVRRKLSPFGLSDHTTINVSRCLDYVPQEQFVVKSRDTGPPNRLNMRKHLEEINRKAMIDCVDTCEEKANLLETIVTSGMNIYDSYENQNYHH